MSGDPALHSGNISRRLYIAAPADLVWEWLVEPDRVAVYHPSDLAARPLAPGDPLEFVSRLCGQPISQGEVLEIVETRRLRYTMRFCQSDAEAPASTVSLELLRFGEQMCCLELRHEGLLPGSDEFDSALASWDVVLSGLKTAVETGKPLPWPRRRH